MFDMAVVNGTVVTAHTMGPANVYIQNGKIAAVTATGSNIGAQVVVDVAGMQVFPGVIDVHAHFQVPGYTHRETFETGSRAAAVGGVTCVVDMPLNNDPPTINADAFRLKRQQIEGTAYTDYALWGGLVDDNYEELEELAACGVVGFKAFLAPVAEGAFTNVNLYQALCGMEKLRRLDGIVGVHCEDPTLLAEGKRRALAGDKGGIDDFLAVHSVLAEKIATANVIELCRETGCRTHICHVSHPEVAALVSAAQRQGLPLTAETCPHYLGLTKDALYAKGGLAKCTPPLRGEQAREGLWRYVLDGTLSCIGSDHSPAMPEEKLDKNKNIWELWGGLNAVQALFPYMYDLAVTQRGLNPCLLARTMAHNPARLFGLYPKKGDIAPGFDADLVIVDPDKEWSLTQETLYTKHPVSVFEGIGGRGCPVLTLLRGRTTAQDGHFCPEAMGWGQFLPRCTNTPSLA